MRQALDIMETMYSPARYSLPEDFGQRSHVQRAVVRQLSEHPDSSPGYPLCLKWKTNKDLVAHLGLDTLVSLVEDRWASVLEGRYAEEADPVRLFVKREPHKKEKIAQKRWRLIWSFSFIDMVVQGMLFNVSNDAELAVPHEIPSKPGFSFFKGGFDKILKSIDGPVLCAEKDHRAWDMHSPKYLYNAEGAFRIRQCNNPTDEFRGAVGQVLDYTAKCKVVFSDGGVYQQEHEGITKSGTKITISFNSHAQVLLKIIYCLEKFGHFDEAQHGLIAQGDDTIERVGGIDVDDMVAWLSAHGYDIKHINVGPARDLEFCSHRFHFADGLWTAMPVNWEKNLFGLMVKEERKLKFLWQQLFSMCIMYAYDDTKFSWVHGLLALEAPSYCRSRDWFKSVHTGYESRVLEEEAARGRFSLSKEPDF